MLASSRQLNKDGAAEHAGFLAELGVEHFWSVRPPAGDQLLS